MRANAICLVVVLGAAALVPATTNAAEPTDALKQKVRIVFVDQPLKEVSQFLKASLGVKIVLADDVQKDQTVKYDGEGKAATVLREMLRPLKLAYEVRKDAIWIVKATKAHLALEKEVGVVFIDQPLNEAVGLLQALTKVEFELAADVSPDLVVSYEAEKEPLEAVLTGLLEPLDLRYEIRKDRIRIVPDGDDQDTDDVQSER